METWVYFCILYCVPPIYVSVLMPVPGFLNYSSLVIKFDIRYCDPSYFVLLSQNYFSYLGSFMVLYKLLKCLFYTCEICHWNFIIYFLNIYYLFIFRTGEGREKEGEKHQCVVVTCMLPTGDPAHKPGMCPMGNQTGDPLVCRPAINPLSHNS